MTLRTLAAILLCATFAACGGGGGGGGPTVSAPAPGPDVTPGSGRPGATPERPPPSDPAVAPVPPAGQAFRGENALETRLSGVTPSGKTLIVDHSCGEADSGHCDRVRRAMTDIGVPDGEIVEGPEFSGRSTAGDETTYWRYRLFNEAAYAALRPELRVVVMPISIPFIAPGTADAVMANNVAFIASAGNTPLDRDTGAPIAAERDLYSDSNLDWRFDDVFRDWGVPGGHSTLEETLDTLRTGKALVVTWANVNGEGAVVPYVFAVKCGDAAEWCLTAILPPDSRSGGGTGTSFAAPIVGAAAYYLSQLWDRAEDVVSTLKTCAIDVGDSGTDREFGVGVVNVDCPTVASREVMAARASMRTETRSPLMDSQGRSGPRSPSASGPVLGFTREGEERPLGGFVVPKVYLSERYSAFGASVPLASGELTGVWGYGTSPLGVSSTLAQASEDSFFEVGYAKSLLRFVEEDGGSDEVSLFGTYGISDDEIDATAGRLGFKYEKESAHSSFSVHAGVLRASAEIGIPGRRQIGRDRVSVSDDSLELQSRYVLRF